jgi:hypothetical protein
MTTLLRHLWVLATEELYDLLRRKRAVFTLIFYLVILALAVQWFSRLQLRFEPITNVLAAAPQLERLRAQLAQLGLAGTLDFIVELSRYPASLWMFQVFTLLWLPTIVGLVSCDMVAMDIDRGTLRFVLQRSSRLAYYAAKTLAHAALFIGLQLVSFFGLVGWCWFSTPNFALADYVSLSGRYFAVSIPFILFVVASTEWISSWSRRPMSAIIRLNVLWVVFFALLGWRTVLSPLGPHATVGLVLPFAEYFWGSLTSFLGWGFGFAALGLLGFLRREV